jgi:hypothetical protein
MGSRNVTDVIKIVANQRSQVARGQGRFRFGQAFIPQSFKINSLFEINPHGPVPHKFLLDSGIASWNPA